jgi:hypothetical protein
VCRLVLIAAIAVTALIASGSASARSEASCNSPMSFSGKTLIVIGTGVNCSTAKSIVRGVFNAPSIGTQRVGRLTLVKLRSPRAGWTCISTTPIRTKGAGCRKTGTGLQVIYVNISG